MKSKILSLLCVLAMVGGLYAGTTTNFGWNYGVRGQDPWWDVWTGMVQSIDTEVYGIKHGTSVLDDVITKGPWVDVRAYASINAAVTAIGSAQTTLVVSTAQTLTASLTIPSTLSLKILKGGSIVKASTYTLAINGPPEIGLYQVFSGFSAGDVTFGSGAVKEVYPEWWRENTVPGTTDMTAAIQAANDSFPASYKAVISLSNTQYGVATSTSINLSARIHLKGVGSFSTVLKALGNNTIIKLAALQEKIEISGILFNGNGTTGKIIDINGASYFHIHDCRLANKTTGIDLTVTGSYWGKIERNIFSGLTNGILLDNTNNAHRIRDNEFNGAMTFGIKSNATFTGDDLNIEGNTFGTTSTTDNILLQTTSGFQGISARILNNRFDGATATSHINLARYVQAIVRGNIHNGVQANHLVVDGTNISVDDNYYAGTTGAAISLTANSNGCDIGHQRWGTGGEICASMWANDGTNNTIFQGDVIQTLENDATPSVMGYRNFITGGTTTITNFDDGYTGQIITIISEHAITITDGTNIFLSGSANFVMAATDTLTLICKADGKWYEIGRSDNT